MEEEKKYIRPEVEIINFYDEDVIRTSLTETINPGNIWDTMDGEDYNG